MLAANRKENSVVPDMSIMENFYLAEHELSGKKPFINSREEAGRYAAQKESLHIKAGDSSDSILSLSGGNQQKVFLARWLNIGADVLLFDNPIRLCEFYHVSADYILGLPKGLPYPER